MTDVVIVGKIYNADLSIGGGPIYPPSGGGQPPGIWGPTDPRPTHPIAGYPWPQPPQGGYPSHPIYYPPYPDQGLPGSQPYPDIGLPGAQPRPDHGLPPFPSHPIAPGGGGQPPGIWGGGNAPFPTPPIYIPPQAPPIDGDNAYIVAYVPNTATGKVERITFTVQVPEEGRPPTEATPK